MATARAPAPVVDAEGLPALEALLPPRPGFGEEVLPAGAAVTVGEVLLIDAALIGGGLMLGFAIGRLHRWWIRRRNR